MIRHHRADTNRSFRWGVEPRFSRGPLLAPPTFPARTRTGGGPHARTTRARRLERRARATGLQISIALHAAAFLVWHASDSASGGDSSGGRAGRIAVSEPIQLVRLAAAEPAPRAAAEVARPRIGVERPALALPDVRVAPAVVRRQLDDRVGTPEGLELGGLAMGRGDGADYTPPIPETILPSWRAARAVYGATALVRVFVDRDGRPKGPVELARATSHRQTDQEIIYRVRHLLYRPAQRNGMAVDAWAEVAFEFCYDGVTATSPPSPTFGAGEPCAKPRAAGTVGTES
jgi:outer membrane biosynthesis protein TonB